MPAIADRPVGRIGYGLMGLTWSPSPPPYETAFRAMKAALARGANFWNAGEFYGPPHANSLQLLRAYFEKYPEDAAKVVLSVKGGIKPGLIPDGSAEGVRTSVQNCLDLLAGSKAIDIFECARVDPNVPIEDTMQTLKQLKAEGRIGGIGLSEVSAETVRRAAAVTPIAAVEVELSLVEPAPTALTACAELGIPVVAYSPLGRGMLTGQIRSAADIPKGDFRTHLPRFQPDALATNLKRVDAVVKLAERKGCTPAQVAVAWVVAQGTPSAPIIPIPGASTVERVDENLHDVNLDMTDLDELSQIVDAHPIQGNRYG